MLKLIGLGLYDERDISVRGVDEAKSCNELYIETYTNVWHGSIENLEKLVGKKVRTLSRNEVESNFLIERAKERNIGLFVVGDPLSATTHIELLIEAKKAGIKARIVHASSIFTAIAETGLQLYKFGKTVSVPKPQENFRPTSFYDEILKNKSSGLHTLVLFDVNNFTFDEAKKFLTSVDKNGLFDNVVVCSELGRGSKIFYGKLSDASARAPFVMIVPGHLHFKEKEALEMFK